MAEFGRSGERARKLPIRTEIPRRSRLISVRLVAPRVAPRGVARQTRGVARYPACGEPDPEPLLAAAREIGLASFLSESFAAAAQHFLALDRREQAHDLLRELDQLVARRNNLVLELPKVVRTALALDDPPLARRLAEGIEPHDPPTRHSLAAAQAQLVEATGDAAEAAQLYADAAERWERFGNLPEHAYALLGHGRCLAALFDPRAGEPLNRAKQLFASMGYNQALAETNGLLGEAAAI